MMGIEIIVLDWLKPVVASDDHITVGAGVYDILTVINTQWNQTAPQPASENTHKTRKILKKNQLYMIHVSVKL